MNALAAIPSLAPALPEIILVLGAMALLMFGAFNGAKATPAVNLASVVLLIAAAALVYLLPGGKAVTFGGSFVVDDFARVMKILALIGSAATILLARDYLVAEGQEKFEFPILILLATTGMMMLISRAD